MELPRHENFGEYTKSEINEVKKHVCIAHKCPYMRRLHQQVTRADNVTSVICDYISLTGHSRGCLPVDCTHYNDTGVRKRIQPFTGEYIYDSDSNPYNCFE